GPAPQLVGSVVGQAATSKTFQIQNGRVVAGGGIWSDFGRSRVQDLDVIFKLGEEQGGATSNQFRHAITGQQAATVSGRVNATNQPFFVADNGTGARSKQQHRGRPSSLRHSCPL